MTDKPILFSGPMIRALLDGRKTQTRRVMKPQPGTDFISADFGPERMAMRPALLFGSDTHRMLQRLPRPGFRLWVRESWHAARSLDRVPPREIPRDADIEHAVTARSYAEIGLKGKLRPGIHMPRWASRLTLIVEDVKIERLQDISEEDAKAEGVEPLHQGFFPYGITTFMTVMQGDREVPAQCTTNAKDSFALLWNSINGPGAWDANPWCAAISFSVIEKNIDQVPA